MKIYLIFNILTKLMMIISKILMIVIIFVIHSPLSKAHQPLSIDDFECGEYIIAGMIKISALGEDQFVIFPEANKEYFVPIRGLKVAESHDLENVRGIFHIQFPLEKGQKQGRFYFKKFIRVASSSEIDHHPILKIINKCKSLP